MARLIREPYVFEEGEITITLRIQRLQGGDDHVCYKTGLRKPLKPLMVDYCRHVGVVYEETRFFYDGARLLGDKTPYELEMEDEDIIEAFAEMENRLGTDEMFISFTTVEEDKRESPLILVVQSHSNGDVFYKIGRGMPLRTVFKDYCERMCFDSQEIRFLYNGSHLKHLDTTTPDELHMKHYDVLSAFTYTRKEIIVFDIEENEEPISLTMGGSSFSGDDEDVYYKTGRSTPLHWMKLDYCERKGFDCEDMGLFSFSAGARIDETKTPQELKMKDHDVIRVLHLT